VLEEGDVAAGDSIESASRDSAAISVAEITSLYVDEEPDLRLMRRAMQVEALPVSWRKYFSKQLGQ
ncbi:MAG TPA: 3-alpha domain-containing protein, partial [Blastocatellia bacterium]|nr:3-alpha domain-containing protein [Blastocatellia bacterium]